MENLWLNLKQGENIMDMREIFSKALGIDKPWFITEVNFDVKAKRLDIKIDFILKAPILI